MKFRNDPTCSSNSKASRAKANGDASPTNPGTGRSTQKTVENVGFFSSFNGDDKRNDEVTKSRSSTLFKRKSSLEEKEDRESPASPRSAVPSIFNRKSKVDESGPEPYGAVSAYLKSMSKDNEEQKEESATRNSVVPAIFKSKSKDKDGDTKSRSSHSFVRKSSNGDVDDRESPSSPRSSVPAIFRRKSKDNEGESGAEPLGAVSAYLKSMSKDNEEQKIESATRNSVVPAIFKSKSKDNEGETKNRTSSISKRESTSEAEGDRESPSPPRNAVPSIFKRKSKDNEGESETGLFIDIPTVFKSNNDNHVQDKDSAPRKSAVPAILRRKSKDNEGDSGTGLVSAGPALFKSKSNDNNVHKSGSAPSNSANPAITRRKSKDNGTAPLTAIPLHVRSKSLDNGQQGQNSAPRKVFRRQSKDNGEESVTELYIDVPTLFPNNDNEEKDQEGTPRTMFRRKSKDKEGERSAAPSNAVTALFASKEIEEQGRVSSPRSTFRRKNKVSVGGEGFGKAAEPHPTCAPTTMRERKSKRKQIKLVYHSFSPNAASVLKVEQDEAVPVLLASNHVLVKVQASTVTLNDCYLRRGFDFNVFQPLSLPLTPGYDVVGTIVDVGSNVADFGIGDKVAALVRWGGNSRFLSVPAGSLVKVPANLDSAEVVALVSIYTTAYQALRKISAGGPMFSLQGKKVLILGGMDGVGQALIQMCRKARATIYVTAPMSRHLYVNKVLGVNPLPETGWLSSVEGELDYVFDGVCEDGTEMSFKALKPSGELVCYGQASMLKEREMGFLGAPFSARLYKLFTKMTFRVHTVDIWESFQHDPATYKTDLTTLCQLLKWNKLKPHIAKRVSMPEVAAAQTKLENGDIRGTIVCFPWRPIRAKNIS